MVLHPLLLHFPIALLVTGTVALALSLLRPGLYFKKPSARLTFEGFVSGALGLGYAGLILTIITGLFDMQASPKTQAKDGWIVIAVIHIITAVMLLVVYGALLYRRFVVLPPLTLPEAASNETLPVGDDPAVSALAPVQVLVETPPQTRPLDWISLMLAGLGLTLLVVAGWLGGTLVYEYRVGIG